MGDHRGSRGSDPAPDALFSRDEVLGGLPARRAQTLLFLIESRTAHLVARSRRAMELVRSEQTERERDLAFIEAFSLGREPPLRPTIQDLERQAPGWASLVPDSPRVRAALAHLLGEKYAFAEHTVPGIRAALGLDEDAVRSAYLRLYDEPLGAIFAPRVARGDRLRWAWVALGRRLESLPPFWTAFALTLTETVGATLLALPIAVAGIGPLAGVVILVLLGIVNQVTIASLAEAFARNGSIRYSDAFFGRLVDEYLGRVGSLILTFAVSATCVIALLAFYVGVATTLADATPVPPEVWTALLFLIGLYYVSRDSLNTTIASALAVGAINLGLILIISLLALAHVRAENLLDRPWPFLGGQAFEPSLLALIFGVVIAAYTGHISTGNCARVVLRRDPSARSLIWGTVAAQATACLLYCLWVVAVSGAVPPAALLGQAGTSLGPLADRLGPSVHVLGSMYAILGMGMVSIHLSIALFNLVREHLPARTAPTPSVSPVATTVTEAGDGPSSPSSSGNPFARRARAVALGDHGRFALGVSPVVGIFLLCEWLLLTDSASFSWLLSLVGVVAASLIAGIFPGLLLLSSRQKGERVPGFTWRLLGHPVVVWGSYLLFLANLFLHAFVIWDGAPERVAAALIGLLVIGGTLTMVRRGAFAPRIVVEVRRDPRDDQGAFSILAAGHPVTADVGLGYPDGRQDQRAAAGGVPAFSTLRSATFGLPATGARELKVWAHQITPEGDSASLPARLEVHANGRREDLDLQPSAGQVVLPLHDDTPRLRVTLQEGH